MLHQICATHHSVPITLEFDDDVYRPGSLTEIMADVMEVRPGDIAVDVGCGTGYLGIMAALLGAHHVFCTDTEPNAVKWTLHNARLNGVANITVLQGGALDPVEHVRADLIVTLPPQMPYPTDFNPWRHGGTDGTDVILKIIAQARRILEKEGGRLYLLHAALADPAKVRRALSEHGFSWEIVRTVKRKFDRAELEALTPGLPDYLLQLAQKDMAEIRERNGQTEYPIWIYKVVPSAHETKPCGLK